MLKFDSIKMVNILGMNPVIGGSPAKEINIIEIDSCAVVEIIGILLICLDLVRFIILSIINRGTISEQ